MIAYGQWRFFCRPLFFCLFQIYVVKEPCLWYIHIWDQKNCIYKALRGYEKMIRVLFVCWGNIGRSPMAEFILKDMVRRRGLQDLFHIESAATSMEEIGNPVYPPARRKLAEHGIGCEGHHARRMERRDYRDFDYLIGMEGINIRSILRMTGGDPEGKVFKMLDFTDRPGDIDDPWYTGDFTTVFEQLYEGCEGFLRRLSEEGRLCM